MDIRTFIFLGNIIFITNLIILALIHSFEYNINKKIDKLNEKINNIGYKTNYIEPQHNDVYTKLNLLSSMLNDIRDLKNGFHTNTNNNEPESEK